MCYKRERNGSDRSMRRRAVNCFPSNQSFPNPGTIVPKMAKTPRLLTAARRSRRRSRPIASAQAFARLASLRFGSGFLLKAR